MCVGVCICQREPPKMALTSTTLYRPSLTPELRHCSAAGETLLLCVRKTWLTNCHQCWYFTSFWEKVFLLALFYTRYFQVMWDGPEQLSHYGVVLKSKGRRRWIKWLEGCKFALVIILMTTETCQDYKMYIHLHQLSIDHHWWLFFAKLLVII